ncbi:DNA starvation/stationary phase protection protein [Salibacter sp.]|jgi:starvation-inducible DNA-binding protein|uniref:Dps family protein n=1 Tax=Salibacter sp. TaxID=2010995 RepID=UPI00286FB216|nr:DNA starvation/stationary phase protection protein [Salibacter sp.]MDR9397649.1 DNA starvation/stationary phase protection protein [Salibacter sp.]MDR9486803.1 DNA starvation/stationary phase protection protein [Salibacter sp.]
MKQYINLNGDHSKTIEKLNELLSTYQVFYQNIRGFHWNIKGQNFFELHVKFEEYYTTAATNIDEVAERILTVGGVPLHSFSDYINTSSIEPIKDLNDGQKMMEIVWNMHNDLLGLMRETVEVADEQDDEGTQDLLAPMISDLEKTNWMVGAWLKK